MKRIDGELPVAFPPTPTENTPGPQRQESQGEASMRERLATHRRSLQQAHAELLGPEFEEEAASTPIVTPQPSFRTARRTVSATGNLPPLDHHRGSLPQAVPSAGCLGPIPDQHRHLPPRPTQSCSVITPSCQIAIGAMPPTTQLGKDTSSAYKDAPSGPRAVRFSADDEAQDDEYEAEQPCRAPSGRIASILWCATADGAS